MKLPSLTTISISICFFLWCTGCKKNSNSLVKTAKQYITSFENMQDFNSFYIEPQNQFNSASHELSTEKYHSGSFAHKAWIYGINPESTPLQNNNHRGYPTIQLYKLKDGFFQTPCYISFWVWLDINLTTHIPENQWFSFATFTTDSSDNWSRTILANLSYDGYVHLMHVPLEGEKNWEFQTTTLKFPTKEWVNIKIYLDTRPNIGYAKIWQNGTLVSYAKIADGNGILAQAHFGLYAAPSIAAGVIYNDDLEIKEVAGE